MVQNGTKRYKTIQNGTKWYKTVQNGTKTVQSEVKFVWEKYSLRKISSLFPDNFFPNNGNWPSLPLQSILFSTLTL